MNRTRVPSPLTGRIFAPALTALVLSVTGLTAHADLASARAALQAQLDAFGAEKTLPTKTYVNGTETAPKAPADDLVYAVYQAAMAGGNYTPSELATAALELNRTDINTVLPRVVGAAIGGGNLETDGAGATAVLTAAVSANSKITAAGKEAAVGRALKTTVGVGNAIGAEAANLAGAAPGATPDAKATAFAIAALKSLGASTGDVQDFTQSFLSSGAVSSTQTTRTTDGINIAAGVATLPNTAGAVIGGLAAEIKAVDANTATSDTDIKNLLTTVLGKTTLAKDVSTAVADALQSYTSDKQSLATTLLSGLGTKATTAVKGAVASGVIASIGSGESQGSVDSLLNAVYNIGSHSGTNADLTAFAGAAAANTGNSAALVLNTIAAKLASPTATNLTSLGSAVEKSIAASSPLSASAVSAALSSNSAFAADSAKVSLAVALAKSVATNGLAAGAAVEGVGTKLNNGVPTEDGLVTLAGQTITGASKAASNITMDLAALLPVGATTQSFATSLANYSAPNESAAKFSAFVAAATAGIAAADPANAGDIAAAVVNTNATEQAKALTIATTVAAKLDVERINDVGQKIAALLVAPPAAGSPPTVSKLPKLSSIGTLGYGLAKIINTLPLVPTANRADEIGELAAVLTNAVIDKVPTPASDMTSVDKAFVPYLSSIASNLFKALSPTLMQNGGAKPADKLDELEDIVGSIAQSISVSSALLSE